MHRWVILEKLKNSPVRMEPVGSPVVSASSPLVGFGKLNDNTIKGLISLLSVEQEIESIAYTCGLCINKYIQGSTSRQT